MINRIKKSLKGRKAKVFVLFLLASGLIWFLNNLSRTYSAKTTFDLAYVNESDELLLTDAFVNSIEVKLETVGFQFLRYNFERMTVLIDLKDIERFDNRYYLPPQKYKGQIEKQLPSSIELLELYSDTLFFDFMKITSKEVSVESTVKINLVNNYLLEGPLKLEPSSITIKGPQEEIDTIAKVFTVNLDLPETNFDFTEKVNLFKSSELQYTSYSTDVVLVSGKVSKFSEKIIEVPIAVINLPEGMQVRTFPDGVSILCKAKIERLKSIDSSNFKVVADYSTIDGTRSNTMELILGSVPDGIFEASLLENKVEFILSKE